MDPLSFELNIEEIYRQWELEWKLEEALLDRQQQLLEELLARSLKREKIERDREHANQKLVKDYFDESPTYTDNQFRRRYRMQRPLFLRIFNSLSNHDTYFTQRKDNARKRGLSSLQKCTAAIRMLAYGVAAYSGDEYVKIGETTAIKCLRRFCDGIISIFEKDYMRSPNAEDLQRLLHVGSERGFPGMIGSIDCMHWQWKNCPKTWQGQFTNGRKGTATVTLEAVASYDLWIWHAFFGLSGSLNGIHVLHRSPVFDDIERGEAPHVNFTVNGHQYNSAYYLANEIYPKWPIFVQSLQYPQGEKTKLFVKQQESCRKDVEHAFGVLQARFNIIRQPVKMWELNDLSKIMRACIILHNMIVENERDTYHRTWENLDFEPSDTSSTSSSFEYQTQVLPQFEAYVQGRSDSDIHTRAELRDRAKHIQLKEDLVEHNWQKFGTVQI